MTLLTIQNKQVIDEARDEHKKGLLEWSSNPSNFDNIMNYLYALERASDKIASSLKDQIKECEYQVYKFKDLITEVYDHLYTKEFNKLIIDEFSKEPRIKSISANCNYESHYNNNFFTKTKTCTTFNIQFSNDEKIEWKAPTFTKVNLIKFKEQFENTMHQLEEKKSLSK